MPNVDFDGPDGQLHIRFILRKDPDEELREWCGRSEHHCGKYQAQRRDMNLRLLDSFRPLAP